MRLPSKNTIYISEADTGIYNAMNKGWKLASPESFTYFLNARDVFAYPDSLSQANKVLTDFPQKNWGCTTHEEKLEDGTGWCCKLVSEPSIRNQLYAFGYRSHQGMLMRQSLLNRLGGFNEELKIASDWDLYVRALLQEAPVEWVYPLAVFELGGTSTERILDAHRELILLRRKYQVTTWRSRLFEELWRMIFLHYMGYSNLLTRTFKTMTQIGLYLKRTVRRLIKAPVPRKGKFYFFGISVTIQRSGRKETRKKKKPNKRPRQGMRNRAIEGGLLIYLNKKLQLEPYQTPRNSSSNHAL
jgi:hypothetical protein